MAYEEVLTVHEGRINLLVCHAGNRHPWDETPAETKTSSFDLRVDYVLPSRYGLLLAASYSAVVNILMHFNFEQILLFTA